MKATKFLFLLFVLFMLVPEAHADGAPVTMVFMGVNGANDGQYYVSPYYGTMNRQTVVLYCVDIINDVNFGQTWQANVTNLASGNLSNTRYGNSAISPVAANAQTLYAEAAWLTTKFANHPSDYVSLQYALWDLMNPGSEPTSYGNVQNWLNLAAANYGSINLSEFAVVTNIGPVTLTGQVQEFIVRTPEPGTLALLICGMLALAMIVSRQRILRA
ncbi:MAG TPA: hypothetical protein VFN26_18705 [Candidatus Acidoferrum sp.]|nr:hypothetical protein [Candidatus Acidoferrum sp.]